MTQTSAEHHRHRTERNDETLKYAAHHKDKYTAQDIDELRQMAGMMKSDAIAIEMGRSLQGVMTKAERHGIPMPDVKTGLVVYKGQKYSQMTLQDAAEERAFMLREHPHTTVAIVKAGQGYIVVRQEGNVRSQDKQRQLSGRVS